MTCSPAVLDGILLVLLEEGNAGAIRLCRNANGAGACEAVIDTAGDAHINIGQGPGGEGRGDGMQERQQDQTEHSGRGRGRMAVSAGTTHEEQDGRRGPVCRLGTASSYVGHLAAMIT